MAAIDEIRGGWITYTDWRVDCRPMIFHPIAFRKDFTLAGKPTGGRLVISAADKYALWVNGRLVGYGPARSYPREKLYDEYDVSRFLRKGTNHFAALVLPCTGANFLANYTRMGLFVQADIKLAGGGKLFVASDETWRCRIADWMKHDYLLITLSVGAQEHVDKNREDDKWKVRACDKSWTPALYLGPAECPPWIKLSPRPIPLLDEKPFAPQLVWKGRGGRAMASTDANLAALFNREELHGAPVPAMKANGEFEAARENGRSDKRGPSFADEHPQEDIRPGRGNPEKKETSDLHRRYAVQTPREGHETRGPEEVRRQKRRRHAAEPVIYPVRGDRRRRLDGCLDVGDGTREVERRHAVPEPAGAVPEDEGKERSAGKDIPCGRRQPQPHRPSSQGALFRWQSHCSRDPSYIGGRYGYASVTGRHMHKNRHDGFSR